MTTYRAVVRHVSRPDVHTVLVSLDGDLVYGTADDVLAQITDQLSAQPTTRVGRVACTALDFCDSWGLSVLLMANRTVDAAGAQLRLENLPPQLTRVLEVTGTVDLFGCPARPRQHGQHGRRET